MSWFQMGLWKSTLLDLAFLHSHYLLLDWRFLVCLIKLWLDLTTFAILLLAFSIIHLLFLSCDICLFFPHLMPFLYWVACFSSVQLLTYVWPFVTPWTAACQASHSVSNSQSLVKLVFIESVMPSNLIVCHPLLLLPSLFPRIGVFSSGSVHCIRWPRYWS